MSNWDDYHIGVDVAKYEPKVDYAFLKENGVRYLIARAGRGTGYFIDSYLGTHYEGARSVGMDFGLYWVHDPWVSPVAQIEYMKRTVTVAGIEPDFISLDVELNSNMSGADLSNHIRNTLDEMLSRFYGVPAILYTRQSFIADYCPQAVSWIQSNNVPLWLAYYPYSMSVQYTTWDHIKATITEAPRVKYLAVGSKQFTIWQINDKFILPGVTDNYGNSTAIDVNIVKNPNWWKKDVDPELPPANVTLESLDKRLKVVEQKVINL